MQLSSLWLVCLLEYRRHLAPTHLLWVRLPTQLTFTANSSAIANYASVIVFATRTADGVQESAELEINVSPPSWVSSGNPHRLHSRGRNSCGRHL